MKTCHPPRVSLWIIAFFTGLGVQGQDPVGQIGGEVAMRTAGRSAHERVLEIVSSESTENGSILSSTNSIIELATGLHYRNEQGEWQESEEIFEIVPGAARAWKGHHRVTLASNPNTPAAVQHRLPDGRLLSSHVYGIGWYDTASGESVLLAGISDTQGVLTEDNVVVYPNALKGNASASIRYTYTKSGFEQDVVLLTAPPPPEAFGLSPATSRLEVWTEFDDPVEPAVRGIAQGGNAASEGDDVELDFGSMRIGTGRFFWLGGETETLGLMVKEWVQEQDGRRFLVEAVAYGNVSESLKQLPATEGGADASGRRHKSRTTLWASTAKPRRTEVQTSRMRRLDPSVDTAIIQYLGRPGLVLDYLSVTSGTTNQVFRGDVMYWVSGSVLLYGTTTFEPGAVIKFDPSSSAGIEIRDGLSWLANPLMPVTLSARDDSGFGETAPGQTTPLTHAGYAGSGLRINGPTTTLINGLRVRNLRRGVEYATGTGHTLRHAQFVDVGEAIRLTGGTAVAAQNLLVTRASTGVFGGTGNATAVVEHATVDGANRLAVSGVFANSAAITVRNSILNRVTNGLSGSYTGGSHTVETSLGAGLFQTLRGGAHYLPAESPHRDTGTASVDSALTTDLRVMTTEAPQELVGEISLSTVLRPIVALDSGTLDRGFHYARIDYAASGVTLTNATLTLTNGVRLATYGSVGMNLRSGAVFRSGGSPNQLNWLTRLALVQEETTAESASPSLLSSLGGSAVPRVEMRFTGFGAGAETTTRRRLLTAEGSSVVVWTMKDCALWNQRFSTYAYSSGLSLTWENNRWHRASVDLYQEALPGYTSFTLNAHNNLWIAGTVILNSGINGTWTLRDSLFDGSTNSQPGGTSWTASNNGYRGATSFGGSNNRTPSLADYQNGPLGTNYYPTSGANLSNLFAVGFRTGTTAGLFHHTLRTDLAAVGTNQVSIGFHYLRTSAGGVPLDSDGDGIPDWMEDANGDGSFQSASETDWAKSPNGTTDAIGLQVFTRFE